MHERKRLRNTPQALRIRECENRKREHGVVLKEYVTKVDPDPNWVSDYPKNKKGKRKKVVCTVNVPAM